MPVSFAILAQTFPAESSTVNEESSSGSVISMLGGPPGLSPSKGPLPICRPQVPLGSGFGPFFPHRQRLEQS